VAHEYIESARRALAPHDERLLLALRRVLWDYEPLRATRAPLVLDVQDGRVRLEGRTRTEALRVIAGYLVSFVPGVVAVDNAIVSDDQVIRAVADALAADPLTAPHVIRVSARYGEVTLAGEVTSAEAEARAVELARAVPGVTEVRSDLARVRPEDVASAAAVQRG
jgi:osmotically-inducible protein OsmY